MLGLRKPLRDQKRLIGKASYFFRSDARSRGEVADFADRVADLGPAAVIGGMLRDLYLDGNRRFVSDVDFVVDPVSLLEFERLIEKFPTERNRFGGYGLRLGRWKVDVWPLERTWAAVEGHISVGKLDDLLAATFFDWDAILYLFPKRDIRTSAEYFQRINGRILDINLEPNPNPLGNAVRALRYARRWKARLGPRLARHVYVQAYEKGWESLVKAERASFTTHLLDKVDGNKVMDVLGALEKSDWSAPAELGLSPVQGELALDR